MKIEKRVPTILGLVVLILGVTAGVFLVSQRQFFRLAASQEFSPVDVRITNTTQDSFTVSWATEKETQGGVIFGTDKSSLKNTKSEEQRGTTHHIGISGLKPKTTYFFKILGGGETFDQNGQSWQHTTGTTLSLREADIISGTVHGQNKQPASRVLVYISLDGSAPLSAISDQEGKFSINLSSTRTANLNNFASYDDASQIAIFAKFETSGVSSAKARVGNARPLPPIVLGQVHDFTKKSTSTDTTSPKSNIQTPTNNNQTQKSSESRFNLETLASQTSTSTALTIENPDEGEKISTTKPEFFGKAPVNSTLEITVESSLVRETITAMPDGSWQWSPKTPLTTGAHKLTVTTKPASGSPQTQVRNFTIVASAAIGGSPAFVSTPSASPSPTPKPTPTAKPTASPSSSIPSTSSGTPVAGDLTMTFVLFILGIGSTFAGLILFRKDQTELI